jgi:hypothetical protein
MFGCLPRGKFLVEQLSDPSRSADQKLPRSILPNRLFDWQLTTLQADPRSMPSALVERKDLSKEQEARELRVNEACRLHVVLRDASVKGSGHVAVEALHGDRLIQDGDVCDEEMEAIELLERGLTQKETSPFFACSLQRPVKSGFALEAVSVPAYHPPEHRRCEARDVMIVVDRRKRVLSPWTEDRFGERLLLDLEDVLTGLT